METTHPFCFRGREGSAAVTYRGNEDPERWGYRLLGLPWPSSLATGLPVLEVDVSTIRALPDPVRRSGIDGERHPLRRTGRSLGFWPSLIAIAIVGR